ncbi:MAG: hypothetical protein IJ329_03590 [Clostridia bacterium]|nr:hypothetical protein [Clostridia bacterium]
MNKEKYKSLEIEIVRFPDTADIVTVSGEDFFGDDIWDFSDQSMFSS